MNEFEQESELLL